MPFTLYLDDAFGRSATSPGAAGSTTGIGNAWIDVPGGRWQLTGAVAEVLPANMHGTGYNTDHLRRPASEAFVGQKVIITFPVGWLPGAGVQVCGVGLRVQGVATDVTPDNYLCFFTSTTVNIYQVVSGTLTSILNFSLTTSMPGVGTTQLQYTVEADPPVSGSTLLTVTLADIGAGGAGVLATTSVSDSIGPQTAGTVQLTEWTNGGSPTGVLVARAQLYQGAPTLTGATCTTISPYDHGVTLIATTTGGTLPINCQFQQAPDVAGSPGTYVNVGPSSTATSYNVTGLTVSTKYWWRAIATDAVPTSVTSAGVSITTPVDALAISCPAGTAGNFAFSSPIFTKFVVTAGNSIVVTGLAGLVDSAATWTGTKTFQITTIGSGAVLTSVAITVADLTGGTTRFGQMWLKAITPYTLAPGTYLIGCADYGATDKWLHNPGSIVTGNTSGGLISFPAAVGYLDPSGASPDGTGPFADFGASFSYHVLASGIGATDYPSDIGWIIPSGVDPTGVTDSTAGIQAAITAAIGNPAGFGPRVVYLAAGTYLVSNRLAWKDPTGQWASYCRLRGAGVGLTTIKLKDNCTGFQTSGSPVAVVHTASLPGGPFDAATGSGYNGFRNFVADLTIDTGIGNPGAIGLIFNATNLAGVYRVNVRSTDPGKVGVAGISMLGYATGPCLFRDVAVDGFNRGIDVAQPEYSQTYERLTLTNQLVEGFRNTINSITIRGLTSTQTGSVPAINNSTSGGLLTLIDATLAGGSGTGIIGAGDHYLRNVTATGYTAALTGVAGTTIAERWSAAQGTNWPSPPGSLNLPISEAPVDFLDANLTHWANVVTFGAVRKALDATRTLQDTDRAAFQAAIDSGATTVYCPAGGEYHIDDTIVIRGSVRRLYLNEAKVIPIGPNFASAGSPRPLFKFSGTVPCQIDGLDGGHFQGVYPGCDWFAHDSAQSVTLRDVSLASIEGSGNCGRTFYCTGNGTGDVFLDDVEGLLSNPGGWHFTNINVWARSFDEETQGPVKIAVVGGKFWCLGLKTESSSNVLAVSAGGQAEILGGLLYPITAGSAAFTATDASLTAVCLLSDYGGADYTNRLAETRYGQPTRTLPTSATPSPRIIMLRAYSYPLPPSALAGPVYGKYT